MSSAVFLKLGKLKMLLLFFLWFHERLQVNAEDIHTTKVFFMPIGPCFFNWNSTRDSFLPNQVLYRTSLLDTPDLPSWMYYTYSKDNTGFIYGVPPPNQKDFQVEIIGLNRKKYESKRRVVKMKVIEKEDKARFEVQMKIDKLNVEDMFRDFRYTTLLNIFKNELWKESASDLYVTFIASAVKLGARLPLIPSEGEGVVIHLGSQANFSVELRSLEKEIQPLRIKKDDTCSGFKKMSVERYFRQYNYTLDWCAFKLVSLKSANNFSNDVGIEKFIVSKALSDVWHPPRRYEIPTRNYMSELAYTLIIPIIMMITLIILLSFILCFHHEGMHDEVSDEFFHSVFYICEDYWRSKRNENTSDELMIQYESVQRVSKTLRSLSSQRDDDIFLKNSPRMSEERNSGIRPNPPPYTSVRQNTHGDF